MNLRQMATDNNGYPLYVFIRSTNPEKEKKELRSILCCLCLKRENIPSIKQMQYWRKNICGHLVEKTPESKHLGRGEYAEEFFVPKPER